MTQASPARAAALAQQPAAGLPLEALLEECAWAVTADKIDAVVARLVAVAAPLRLIAFGSAARAPLEGANDLDLLVVEPTVANRYSEVVRLQKALRGLLIPVDLVVSSQAATNQRCHGPGTLEFTARPQGRLLHDSP
jgi:predicted nucleotidyltransferase